MSTTDSADRVLGLRPGELVRVRSAAEIIGTLDERGTLDGLPFMPEMVQYCRRTFSVHKRADKTCGHSFVWLRRVHNAVHLSDVRCDGAAHGGCQAACLMYWKEAWLERVALNGTLPSPQLTAGSNGTSTAPKFAAQEDTFVRDTLLPMTTSRPSSSSDPVYRCQVTELPRASTQLHVWCFDQYPRDVRNWGLLKVLRGLAIEAFNRFQTRSRQFLPQRMLIRGGAHYPFLIPRSEDTAPVSAAHLDLQPGDLVRIKSKEEILATLDSANKHRGLSFDVEMLKYCGRTARVRGRVERLIDEKTGEMITIRRDCVILDGVVCTGDYHGCCTRSVFPYWREIWLEKIA
jgi:hypothetical protein